MLDKGEWRPVKTTPVKMEIDGNITYCNKPYRVEFILESSYHSHLIFRIYHVKMQMLDGVEWRPMKTTPVKMEREIFKSHVKTLLPALKLSKNYRYRGEIPDSL